MRDTPSRSSTRAPIAARPAREPGESDAAPAGPRAALAKAIPRRPRVPWWLGIVLALSFAAVVTPAITAERWLLRFQPGAVTARQAAPYTVRAPMLAGYDNLQLRGGVVIARGEVASRDEASIADAIADALPRGPTLYLALFGLTFALAAMFTHHMRRSTHGRLVRVQVVSLAGIAVLAVGVKIALASTAVSALVVPVAALAMVPTMALDRIVGLATGVLAALVISLLAPFDVGLAILLLVQAATAGLVVSERPRRRWLAALGAGLAATLCTAATFVLLTYLTTGQLPEIHDPLHSPWVAAAVGPAIAALIAVPLIPVYQLLVGEITQGRLFVLEDLGHPLLRQIAERAPGTWQHSLMMANMAEIAANAIGANGRLVRVGAYFHDLGKSLQPKYFIENLEAGETSPHDQLPPEVSCDAIFAHVTEGLATARKAGLHERIVDFMHMHHGNGVLEYFWAKCREQGNPDELTVEQFRYPGHPPQSRETAILAICDAVEAASRTLKKPDPAAIDSLVQRIVYGKLHLGQLDESGLSMSDLRRISDSLRETIRHANHGRIEYPWQKAGQDASASVMSLVTASPRLDSLDRRPGRDRARSASPPPPADGDAALAATADVKSPAAARPANGEARPAADAPDSARIRAGTARNAHAAGAGGAGSAAGDGDTPGDSGDDSDDGARAVHAPARDPSAARAMPVAATRDAGDARRSPSVPARGTMATMPGRAPGPLPPPPDVIGPATFAPPPEDLPTGLATAAPLSPAALASAMPIGSDAAITLPALARMATPAAPAASDATAPPVDAGGTRPGMPAAAPRAPGPSAAARSSGPPTPPPGRSAAAALSGDDRVTIRPRARAAAALDGTAPPFGGAAGRTVDGTAPPSGDPGTTEPSLPVVTGDADRWARETPVVPPTTAEMRALLGHPDPTRQIPLDEIEALHQRAAELRDSLPALAGPPAATPPGDAGRRRTPFPTAEVDPDDIEAAIEVAPPVRRRPATANTIGVARARPKKPAE